MIPRPGDLIESNHIGCNRYRVVEISRSDDRVHLFCHVVYPPEDKNHPRNVEAWFNEMHEDGDLIVSDWYEPWMGYYRALTGTDDTSPRRLEFRIIGRGHYEEQLALFGEAA